MSEGHPTEPQLEALRLICTAEPLSTEQLAASLIEARPGSTNPGYPRAIARMAGTLTWRLLAQHFVTETSSGTWRTTPAGRDLLGCART
ncbi:hypothetical protein GT755_04895 [Herbidospora sp. NEAU-GS84]|uniref:Restriction system protein Mrr-like N-terminal domain-containing protein n=1 Tax=Herbidospora solisilvae TaxID=2696284 RepID=A0A7C9JBW9_9ACTN|nr:hypothetical protein [Herbidospora solisilvae]NAS21023.1 hypothetical protein [Herbidospora solisilvae]